MSLPEQLANQLSAAAASQTEMSGHWVGALVLSLVGAAFAAGTSLLGGMPLTRLQAMREGVAASGAASLGRYLADPTKVLSRWLVGRIVCTASTAILIGDAVRGLSPIWAVPTAILGTLATYGLITEVVTTLSRHNPARAAPTLLRVLRPFELLAAPFAWPIAAAARLSGRLMPPYSPSDGRTTEHEVGLLLAEGQRAGTLGEEHAQMIQNVLEFTDLTAADVMVPRTKLIAVDAEMTLAHVLLVVSGEGHSRYPVFRESVDNIIGLLCAKDLFRVMNDADAQTVKVHTFIRTPVNFVPETQPISRLLREMRARRLHMAVVVDDYGGVSGIVTLEDIVEQIIGDIQDEHDAEENPVVHLSEGRWLVNAEIPVDDLAQVLDTDFTSDGDFVSLGGMLIHEAGRVPAAGDEIAAFGFRFIVRVADERKVSKVEVVRADHSAASGSGSGDTTSAANET